MSPKITAVVSRGRNAGLELRPHRMRDGSFVVSLSRFKKDYVYLRSMEDVVEHVRRGYCLRMSGERPKTAPSLIAPSSMRIDHERLPS